MRFPAFALAMIVVALAALATTASANSIRDVRVAQNDGFIRAVIELESAPYYRTRNASRDEGRVSVEVRSVGRAPSSPTVLGEIPHLSRATVDHRSGDRLFYLHLDTKEEVRVEVTRLSTPDRLAVDLYPVDGAPPRPATSSNAPAQPSGQTTASVPSRSGPTTAPTVGPVAGVRPRIVVIDAGHGGRHRGGVGRVGNRQIDEAEVVLPLALKLEEMMKADPLLEPRLTRRRDVYIGLRERTRMAEQFNGDVFLSIHYNAVPSNRAGTSARGLEFWTWSPRDGDTVGERYLQTINNEEGDSSDVSRVNSAARNVLSQLMVDALLEQSLESRVLAKNLEKAFLRDSYFRNHYRGIKDGRFKVLENYNMPSVLIEVAFISHPDEARMSLDQAFQDRVVRYMYEGTVAYFEETDPAFRAARARLNSTTTAANR